MLSHFLLAQVYVFLLLFCRVGAALMILPGFGEPYVSPRIRLGLALTFSLLLVPSAGHALPAIPSSPFALFLLIVSELMIGIFIGALVNVLTSAMHTTGMIISYQTGLSSAVLFDVSQATQGTAIGNFLGIMAVTLMFALDLHHYMLQGILDSYTLFLPGHALSLGDFTDLYAAMLGKTFLMAVKLSAPLIVIGLLLSLAAGVLSRLMPIIPIFFIILAPQMLIGFFIIMITISGLMLWYMQFLEDTIKGMF